MSESSGPADPQPVEPSSRDAQILALSLVLLVALVGTVVAWRMQPTDDEDYLADVRTSLVDLSSRAPLLGFATDDESLQQVRNGRQIWQHWVPRLVRGYEDGRLTDEELKVRVDRAIPALEETTRDMSTAAATMDDADLKLASVALTGSYTDQLTALRALSVALGESDQGAVDRALRQIDRASDAVAETRQWLR